VNNIVEKRTRKPFERVKKVKNSLSVYLWSSKYGESDKVLDYINEYTYKEIKSQTVTIQFKSFPTTLGKAKVIKLVFSTVFFPHVFGAAIGCKKEINKAGGEIIYYNHKFKVAEKKSLFYAFPCLEFKGNENSKLNMFLKRTKSSKHTTIVFRNSIVTDLGKLKELKAVLAEARAKKNNNK